MRDELQPGLNRGVVRVLYVFDLYSWFSFIRVTGLFLCRLVAGRIDASGVPYCYIIDNQWFVFI